MKRSFATRAVSILLALIMCLAMTACGKSTNAEGGSSSPAPAKDGIQPAPTGFVYTSDYKKLFETNDKDAIRSLSIRHYTPEGIYATSWEKVGEREHGDRVPQYEGEFDIYSTFIYFIDNNGKLTKLADYKPIEAMTNENGYKEFSSGTGLDSVIFTDDGIVTIESLYASWYNGIEENVELYSEEYYTHQKYIQEYYIRHLDADGRELSSALIPTDEGVYINTYNMKLDRDGNALIITGDNVVQAIAADGSTAYTIDAGDSYYLDNFVRFADGSLGLVVYEENTMLYKLDEDSKTLVDGQVISFNAYQCYKGTGEYDLYVTRGTNLCGYNFKENRLDPLFNWISCNVNSEGTEVLSIEDDGTIIATNTRWSKTNNSNTTNLITVSKVPASSVPQKTVLTLASTIYLDIAVIDAIIDFNRNSKDCRIEVADYSQYNSEEAGWDAGATKLKTEILSGKIPDIICVDGSGLSYKQLASKGLLEDLYPYIDSDKELKRSDFFPTVLDAFAVDGKLYSTVSGFYINSVLGASSVVGKEPGWTYEKFAAALASMPEGCTAFDEYLTRYDLLNVCLALDIDSFVNWATGECSFDSDSFKQLLEFVNGFPDEYDWENYEYSGESTSDRLAQGKQMLMQTSAFTIEDVFYNNYTEFLGGEVTYIGYPTNSGTGNMFSANGPAFAMSSRCANKDAAWSFMRTFFTKEYQNENIYSLSSRIDIFEEKAKDATTVQYQKNDAGDYLLDEKGEKIPVSRFSMWGQDGKETRIYALDKADVDKIRELIDSTSKVSDYNDSIYQIVREQAEAYFHGQKSLDDVARLIQSKANIYVNEQR